MRLGRRALVATAALAAPLVARAGGAGTADIRFAGAGGIELAGTLVLPERPHKVPGVVLIAGSGPTDRDGNNPLIPVKVDLLKQLAGRLAEAGIASLRYDKRGIGRSTRAPARLAEQELFFGWENFIGDVQLAHAELVRHDAVKGYATALLGHSEGGLFALATAQASGARAPYALVLAGTPGRPLGEIIRRQLQRAAPALVEPADRIMSEIRRTRHVPADIPRELALYFPPYIGAFLQGELAFDPASVLAGLPQPCLLLQGSADQQVVPMDDIQPLLDALSRRSAPGEAAVFPLVSHNLKTVTDAGDPGFAGPVAAPVADRLAAWLAATLGA
jgi:hypothetical protein